MIKYQPARLILSFFLGLCSAVCLAQEKKLDPEQLKKAAQTFDKGQKWAILIGVGQFEDEAFARIDYCADDAKLMGKILQENCGYDKDRILPMTDDQKNVRLRPTLPMLEDKVRFWLNRAKERDTVLVYFSGHGQLDNGQHFLVTINAQRNNLGFTALKTQTLRGWLDSCKAKQKLLILDCCHAGADDKGDAGAGPSAEEMAQAFAGAKGLITLASCGKDEHAYSFKPEGKEKIVSIFTHFLVEGLGGKADYDGDGIVNSDELYRYTCEKVPPIAKIQKGLQNPRRPISSDAIGVFALARVTDPQKIARLLEQGRSHADRGEPELAIAKYSEALRLDQKNSSAFVGRGESFLEVRDFDNALDDAESALKYAPKLAHAYRLKAEVLRELGLLENSITAFRKAIEFDPEDKDAFRGLTDVYAVKGQLKDLINEYEKKIKADPKNPLCHTELGHACLHEGLYESAISHSSDAITLDPKNGYAYAFLAEARREKWNPEKDPSGELEEIINDLNKAINLNPKFSEAYLFRAYAYHTRGAVAGNNEDFEKANEDFEKAVDDCKKVLQRQRNYKRALFERGELYSNMGKDDDAIRDFSRVITLDDHDREAFEMLAVLHEKKGLKEQAAEYRKKANAIQKPPQKVAKPKEV